MKLGLLKVAVSRRAYLIKEIGINCVMDRGLLQISLLYERNIREGRQNSDILDSCINILQNTRTQYLDTEIVYPFVIISFSL